MKPKAIFLDMDGTILTHQNKVNQKTKEIIDQLRETGVYVFIATGRDAGEIQGLVPEDFQVDGLITSNGAAGYVNGENIFKHSLPFPLVKTVIEKAREHQVYYELFPYEASRIVLKEDKPFILEEVKEPKPETVGINEWVSRQEAVEGKIAWTEQIVGEEFSKFYLFARTEEKINRFKNDLEQVKEKIDFTASSSSKFNVEVMAANTNKATGIQQMLEHFQLTGSEILAIGDSYNDLPMLQFVDTAVAMQNAPDYIKQIADEVTDYTCDEDGVYHYLKAKYEL